MSLRSTVLSALLLIASLPLSAAAPDVDTSARGVLDRGYTRYTEGKYAEAVTLLRIASFDSLDDLPSFERANVYVALCASRMGDHLGVSNAVAKVSEAERLAPAFASLNLGADRAAFEALARPLGFVPGVPSSRSSSPRPSSPSAPPPSSPASTTNLHSSPTAVPVPATSTHASNPPVRPTPPAPSGSATNGETSGVVTVSPLHDGYALQIAIACEQSTIDRFREQFRQLRAEPIKIKGRSCFKVLVGQYASAGAAHAARASVRTKAEMKEMPIVVQIP